MFERITGKQGMGAGDFKLLAASGAWVGWMALPMLVLIASVSGVIVALIARLLKRVQPGGASPVGPHLVLASGLLAVAGPVSLMNAWLL